MSLHPSLVSALVTVGQFTRIGLPSPPPTPAFGTIMTNSSVQFRHNYAIHDRRPASPFEGGPAMRGLVLSTIRYLMRTEVHTFAFSVAANALLSFFPFVVLLMTLIRRLFRSRGDVRGGRATAS